MVSGVKEKSVKLTSPTIMGSGPHCKLKMKLFYRFHAGYIVSVITRHIKRTVGLYRNPIKEKIKQLKSIDIPIGRIKEPYIVEIELFVKKALAVILIDGIELKDCDGFKDTIDDCKTGEFQCSTETCINNNLLCNLQVNCFYGEDENDKHCGTSNIFKCDFEGKENCSMVKIKPRVYNETKVTIVSHHVNGTSPFFMMVDHTSKSSTGKALLFNLTKGRLQSIFKTVTLPALPHSVILNQTCKMVFSYYADDNFDLHPPSYMNIHAKLFQDGNAIHTEKIQNVQNNRHTWITDSFTVSKLDSSGYYWDIRVSSSKSNTWLYIDDIYLTPACYRQQVDTSSMSHTTENRNEENPTHMIISLVSVISILITAMTVLVIGYRKRLIKCRRPIRHNLSEYQRTAIPFASILASPEMEEHLNRVMAETNPEYDWLNERTLKETIHNIPGSRLEIISLIGEGAFGEVYKANLSSPAKTVAIKKLPLIASDQAKTDFLFEAITMSKFKHPNIVDCIGISRDNGALLLVLEFMNGGDIRAFLRDSRPSEEHGRTITPVELANLGIDIAKGCWYLEQNKFIHRDIAARNCLLTCTGPSRVAKITDFGMARDVLLSDYYRKHGQAVLPVRWMPPEALLDGFFSSKSDVWAFGVLLWEIYSYGYRPYPGLSNPDVIDYVGEGGTLEQPKECPREMYMAMKACWNPLPQERPSFRNLVTRLENIRKTLMPPSTPSAIPRVRFQSEHLNSYDYQESAPLITNTQCTNSENRTVHESI